MAKKDYVHIEEDRIKFASSYNYLGNSLQTSGPTFSLHIKGRTTAAIRAMHDVRNRGLLSLSTAVTLFTLKIVPVDMDPPSGEEPWYVRRGDGHVPETSPACSEVHPVVSGLLHGQR